MDRIASTSESQNITGSMSAQTLVNLQDLRDNNMLCDAVLRLQDGSEFPVHRAILSACSAYFRALFTTRLHNEDKRDILLHGVTSDALRQIINYAYSRKIELTKENACDLLIASDYLSMLGVLELCCKFIKSKLSEENCVRIMMFARAYFQESLETHARKYFLDHFVRVAYQDDFLDLTDDELFEIISCDELNVKSEKIVWETVLRWINHDPEKRAAAIVKLLSAVRLGLLSTQYFLENVKDNVYVSADEQCRPIIINTLKFLYDLEMTNLNGNKLPLPAIAKPRIPHEVLFAIGGWSGGSPTNIIEAYDTRADRWILMDEIDPNGPRAYHGTAIIGFCIYVIGGFNGNEYFNSCRCFDAVSKTWKEIAPMNARRCYVSVTTIGDLIYAMGGYDGHNRLSSAEKYDFRSNQWSLIASMNVQRSDANACTLNDKIYITGGFNGQECMQSVEVYDPETNQWSFTAPMRSRRSGVSCVSYHGMVFVLGGFNGISRMCSGEKYDPLTNTWTPVVDMYHPRSNFAVDVVDDMIFSIGGFNGMTTIFHVECYDDKTNEWYEAAEMSVCRSALSACVVAGLPNIYDYIKKNCANMIDETQQQSASERNEVDENIENGIHPPIAPPMQLDQIGPQMMVPLGEEPFPPLGLFLEYNAAENDDNEIMDDGDVRDVFEDILMDGEIDAQSFELDDADADDELDDIDDEFYDQD